MRQSTALVLSAMALVCPPALAGDSTAPLVNEAFTPAEEALWRERAVEWNDAPPAGLDLSDAAVAAYARTCSQRLGGEAQARATTVELSSGDTKTTWSLRALQATVAGKVELLRLEAASPRLALDVFGAADFGPLRPDLVEVRGRQLVVVRGAGGPLSHADYRDVLEVAWVAQSPEGWQRWLGTTVYLPSGGFARTSESLGPAAWWAEEVRRSCQERGTLESLSRPDSSHIVRRWRGRLPDGAVVEARDEPDTRLHGGSQLARGATVEEVARLWALLEWRYGAPERPRQDPEALPELFPIEPLRRAAARDLRVIAVASHMFSMDVGRPIASLHELVVSPLGPAVAPGPFPPVGEEDEGPREVRWNGPYLRGALVDPWGRDYRFELLEDGIRVFSLGADGQVGGTDRAADIELVHPPR